VVCLLSFAYALDYPHTGVNSISCSSCHYTHGILPPWVAPPGPTIDDTQYNNLCWSCHNNLGTAELVLTHSSLQISAKYGNWTVECRTCHDPHQQRQFRAYGNASYLISGTVTVITSDTITTDAVLTPNQYQNLVVIPNVSQSNYNYKILSNTANTLTVLGPVDLTKVSVGNTFAVLYGKLIRETIVLDKIINPTPPRTGNKAVKFFNNAGPNSFADDDTIYNGICEVCHVQTNHFRNDGQGTDQLHTNMGSPVGTNCTRCHKHVTGFIGMGGGAHSTHVTKGYGPQLTCTDCHGTNAPPLLADGQNLANTAVCNNCHSATGAATAKNYWSNAGSSEGTAGSWAVVGSETSYCGSCHDATPGYNGGDAAFNVMGNGTTYGYVLTGHGKTTGNYTRLSWQDTTATGNPAANRQCSACHDLSGTHFNTSTKRLKAGYENDSNNSNCKQCHNPGTVAVANPQWYSTYAAYESSAHKTVGNLKCSNCHDVHGASGSYAGMTTANKQNLCLQTGCHSGQSGHATGVSFGKSSKTYTLECVSCHNVHIVTGKFTVDSNKSPLTTLSNNLVIWGDDAGEKMNDYAGSGTYRTPKGETLTGNQLPDYPTFCLDCHGQNMSPSIHGNISWGDMHGTAASNSPQGGNQCPNWYMCGLTEGWDGDNCVAADPNDCWPTMTRSLGDDRFSRPPYNHIERIANVNFVMSCDNCHVTHVSGSGKMRSTINNSPASMSDWKTVCNACHYQGGVNHAGMSCGAANSCHDANPNPRLGFPSESLHGMPNGGSGGGARIFNPDLVLDMRFENNLNDSGTWRLHSKWYSASGTFAAGKSGNAAVFGEDIGVQVGTTNGYWSTDEGNHGTWKYTEMKFNTTLEAWVYPTDSAKSEYTIFNKHVGYNNGGYAFTLKNLNGSLRAAFYMQADNNGVAQDGRAGVRGAYSSVAVPLNVWTHVAVTFDMSGPDRDSNDKSVGRIRIYVNGTDVTTGDGSGVMMQPGAGETSIFAYSENSPWNEGICYNGTWCASEFSIGGFDWETTNFIGRIDEAKVWNITKGASYFETYNQQSAPYISAVEGLIGSNKLTVTFSEGVYTNPVSSGSLVLADFVLIDTDNGRTITAVNHTAGSSTSELTLSSALDDTSDIGVDTLAAAANAIFDKFNNPAGTTAVTITMSAICPVGQVVFNLNEASGSAYVFDAQGILSGKVNGTGTLTNSEYSGGGDGSGRYIDFENNDTCLQTSASLTIETRIKPGGLDVVAGSTDYMRRIIDRTGGGNYQLSVWRDMANTSFPNFTPPDYIASIALWVNVVDAHGGNSWKPVLTNYSTCPIQNNHWYQIKAIWNTNKPGGTAGQFFVPADIYVDDQGTDGNGAGESWTGYANCTNSSQSYNDDTRKLYTADSILTGSGDFVIGASPSNHANNLFNGLIDWIIWKNYAVSGTNNEPMLSWTGESNYTNDGVYPDNALTGSSFEFRVSYADAENQAPNIIQLWVDANDNGSYESNEKYDMTGVNSGDTVYTDGKLYTKTLLLNYAGDGKFYYRFYASDGSDPAAGLPASNSIVTVNREISVPAEYSTIQAAINAASYYGDIVIVSDGTYSENINFNDKLITVKSVNGAASTKIQGTVSNSPVVTFGSGETANAVLDGFTIDNQASAGTLSRGISITNNSSPTIKNCVVEGNAMSTGYNGAGIYINAGSATIENTTLGGNAANKNTCGSGCGLYTEALSGPLSISNSTVSENTSTNAGAGIYLLSNGAQITTITNTTFTNNTATLSGGAIYSNDSKLSISGGSFTGNSTGINQNGGAIHSQGGNSELSIDGITFTGNSSGNLGGAIYVYNSTLAVPLSISNSTFTGNTATQSGGAIALNSLTNAAIISSTTISNNSITLNKGGGIYLTSAPLTMTNTNVNNNTAGLEGGGIYANGATSVLNITGGSVNGNSGTSGGGIFLTNSATLTATGTTINSNTDAAGGNGGGIYAAGSTLTINKANIKGNRGGYDGGGIYTNTTNVNITNSMITGNTTDQQTTNSDGGGIYVAGGTVNIYNSTIAGNYASGAFSGGGGGLRVNGGTVTVRNSIIHSNTAGNNPQVSGAPTTTYTDIQGGCTSCLDKTGNIDSDPRFINFQQASSGNPTTAGNFHICNGVGDPAGCTASSSCIDTASSTNAPADDIDGNARPYDVSGIGDGIADYDMGADEYAP
jgi:predicted CXXCH cytochrome family protein